MKIPYAFNTVEHPWILDKWFGTMIIVEQCLSRATKPGNVWLKVPPRSKEVALTRLHQGSHSPQKDIFFSASFTRLGKLCLTERGGGEYITSPLPAWHTHEPTQTSRLPIRKYLIYQHSDSCLYISIKDISSWPSWWLSFQRLHTYTQGGLQFIHTSLCDLTSNKSHSNCGNFLSNVRLHVAFTCLHKMM